MESTESPLYINSKNCMEGKIDNSKLSIQTKAADKCKYKVLYFVDDSNRYLQLEHV